MFYVDNLSELDRWLTDFGWRTIDRSAVCLQSISTPEILHKHGVFVLWTLVQDLSLTTPCDIQLYYTGNVDEIAVYVQTL